MRYDRYDMGSKKLNAQTGDRGEMIATTFLEEHGYVIIAKKVRTVWCEIDLLARKDGILHVVEVKSIASPYGSTDYRPEELVHAWKLRKLTTFVEWYMNDHPKEAEYRIDVVVVYLDMRRHRAQCRLIEQ